MGYAYGRGLGAGNKIARAKCPLGQACTCPILRGRPLITSAADYLSGDFCR